LFNLRSQISTASVGHIREFSAESIVPIVVMSLNAEPPQKFVDFSPNPVYGPNALSAEFTGLPGECQEHTEDVGIESAFIPASGGSIFGGVRARARPRLRFPLSRSTSIRARAWGEMPGGYILDSEQRSSSGLNIAGSAFHLL